MKSKLILWLGITLIVEIGLLHIMTAQKEYEEAAYLGYLFAANFFGSLVAAFGMYFKQRWGWMIGAAIAAGSIAGYIWSRTLGMPGMNVEEWITPYGVVALSLETAFLALLFFQPWKLPDVQPVSPGLLFNRAQIAGGLFVLIAVSVMTNEWNKTVVRSYGHHVGSLDQVCSTPATSFVELEEKYGMQVSLAAVSMMDSIVDVRIKIIDPSKAHALLQNQAALLVGQQSLILAPHMHSHTGSRLKAGKIFTIFFPTSRVISHGSEVSLVFGPIRVEPIVVR